ncbi:hypothetical protein ACVIGB_000464 [Bradyrhizobium sp. USDA 4341]
MGQAKLRGSLQDRVTAAGDKPKRETKDEIRHREMLAKAEVPAGHVGLAVHEKGTLISVQHIAKQAFVEGAAIPSTQAVSKMKGILRGDPATDPKAFHYFRHAGFDRMRARQFIGVGFVLWTLVNDPEIGQAVAAKIEDVYAAHGRAAVMLVADGTKLHVAIGDTFPDLGNPNVSSTEERSVHTVGMTYAVI